MGILKREAPSLLAMVGAAVISAAAFPWLPFRLPVHWGIDGSADTLAPRAWAVLLNPAGMLLIYLFFLFVRYADRSRAERLDRLGVFEPLRHGAVIFFGFTHALAIGSGLGVVADDLNFLAASGSFLLLSAGFLLRHPAPRFESEDGSLPEFLHRGAGAVLRLFSVEQSDAARAAFRWIPTFSGIAGIVGACLGNRHWLWFLLVAAIGLALLRHRYGVRSR